MNVIGLMSRGYLGSGIIFVPDVTPPAVRVEEDQPIIRGARVRKDTAPTITARSPRPSLRGATTTTTLPAGAPSITKAKAEKPTIRKARKDP